MRFGSVVTVVLVLGLAACGSGEQVDRPELADVMPVVPLPPDSRAVDVAGSEDAMLFTFLSRHDPDEMASYYRRLFTESPWTLISDSKSADGATIIYAENDKTPLWVRIFRTAGAPGSTIQLSGALVQRDSSLVDSLQNQEPPAAPE